MRADRHYVDLLASPAAGQPVRTIPVSEIDAHSLPPATGLRPLIDSIRLLGVVQPLLVRRRDTRYELIAGGKRLAAARAIRLSAVPCLVHDADDQKAAALAMADNLRPDSSQVASMEPVAAQDIHRMIAEHLATISQCAGVCGSNSSPLAGSMLDMVRAHAWRAARLIDALDLVAGNRFPDRRLRALASIVDEMIDGFTPECAPNGIVLEYHGCDDVSASGLNDRELLAAMSAAVMALLPLGSRGVRRTIVIKTANTSTGGLIFTFTLAGAIVSDRIARRFFDDPDATAYSSGAAGAAAARAIKTFAERHDGVASFEALASGACLTISLGRQS